MKSILITGGTGSFANAFVRRIIDDDIERIVLYSRDEQKQNDMDQALKEHSGYGKLRFFIGDVRDQSRLEFAMHGIDTVIHAAALKIVPAMEYNPTECVATNIYGTENVYKAAIRCGVKKVIGLTTDKAVNPINLYGATKLAAEKILLAANSLGAGTTRFSIVRYGNVNNSRGSVLPFFQKIAAQGKPLPITDLRMTRFWITMDQAIDLVLYSHGVMQGREVFIPKIPSIKILDLAEAVSGCRDFWLETGIRPGEKINECLLTEDESRNAVQNDYCYCIIDRNHHRIFPWHIEDKVSEGFRYTSDTNKDWLSVDQIKEIINAGMEKQEAGH